MKYTAVALSILFIMGTAIVLVDNDDHNIVQTVQAGEIDTGQNTALSSNPQLRTGEHNLNEYPAEYFAYADNYYFGGVMEKIDINADGYMDLVVGHYSQYEYVSIFDGKTDLKFPKLLMSENSARWTITGDYYYFGKDFAVGDVNGDGYDDLLISFAYSTTREEAHLFYGGPHWDSRNKLSSTDSDVVVRESLDATSYFGRPVALGDLDGDGYDDIIVGAPYTAYGGNSYSGKVTWWYGSANMKGVYTESTRGGAFYGEYYNFLGGGEISTGDFNGDGRDDLAIGSPYHQINSNYGTGSVYVIYPKSNFRSFSTAVLSYTNTFSYFDKAFYEGLGYYSCYGNNIHFFDYDGDGYDDLTIGSGYISTSTSYIHNTEYVFLIHGRSNPRTGHLKLTSTSDYDIRFLSGDGNRGVGAHSWGDYNNDGKPDLLMGEYIAKKAYVVLNEEFNRTSGDVDIEEVAYLTIVGPTGSNYFAHPGYYSYSYSYPVGTTVLFWDRDGDGYEEPFISDYYYQSSSSSTYGAVWGISAFNMVGIGDLEVAGGDLPNKKTFYAEWKNYTITGSAWNKWEIDGTTKMDFFIHLQNYIVQVTYEKGSGLTMTGDTLGALVIDPNYRIYFEPDQDMMYLSFNISFTMNYPEECDIDVELWVYAAHIHYNKMIRDVAQIRNKFIFVGTMDPYWVKENGEKELLQYNSWMPSGQDIEFTGMKLVYNGTQNFMEEFGREPLYPDNSLFRIVAESNLGLKVVDDSSSGRNFTLPISVGNKPLKVDFLLYQEGIPSNKLINTIPGFSVRVDTDTPSDPPGIQVHADDFDDPNTFVDNDGTLFVTWQVPGEYSSGVKFYEVRINGDDGTIVTTPTTFSKIETEESGRIDVEVRATDRVGHVGEWGSSYIFIDKEALEFTDPYPSPDEWFNMLDPEVGITVTDIGGIGIQGKTVEYTVSYDGGETWGSWISADVHMNAPSFVVSIRPMLMEGSRNQVRFRAGDEAGNFMESDPISVNVDISGVSFGQLLVDGQSDWEFEWFDDGIVDIEISMTDEFSGVNPDTVEYKLTTKGRMDINSAPWKKISSLNGGNSIDLVLEDLPLAKGDGNFIQFRARDVLDNAFSYSKLCNIWVNTDPVPVMNYPKDDSK
ncbi:MAG: FG-GAP and VCBS repeat-containing protein, partial [Thermoplasmatota archaeon]